MQRGRRDTASLRLVLCLVACTALPAAPVAAKSHLWRFNEVFSDANGTVQFIEMRVTDPNGTGEYVTGGYSLTSNATTFVIPHDLPAENTLNRHMLFATQEFADLPGTPAPDFILPGSFFDPAGDELRYRFSIDVMTLAPGALPGDGVHSLAADLSPQVNSPTNFANETASISIGPIPALPARGVALAVAVLAALAVLLAARSRSVA